MPKGAEHVKDRNCERKIKLSFAIYADFKSILVSEVRKQNPKELYTNKYQKHVTCSYC